ncbi:MAG: Rid family hydrolase [Pseudomonadota bacterium]
MKALKRLALASAVLAMGSLMATATPTTHAQEIERKGEGRHFYTTIRVPANAEIMYLSGAGASRQEDGTWGDMEQQTIDTFNGFRDKLEAEGWSMSDIIQVRAFGVADEHGVLDFDGFNRAYRQFFGTEENPQKPVRSFVEIEDLVVDGWLIEIEIRAARVP